MPPSRPPSRGPSSRAPSALPYEARLRRRGGRRDHRARHGLPARSPRTAAWWRSRACLADVSAEHAARTRLVQADRLSTLGTLAAGVAHEINNPAAFILLGLDMLDRLLCAAPSVRMEGSAASQRVASSCASCATRSGASSTSSAICSLFASPAAARRARARIADGREPHRRVRAQPDARPDHRARADRETTSPKCRRCSWMRAGSVRSS